MTVPSGPPGLEALAASAAEFARGAGEILLGLFGKRVEVSYKDKNQSDPVSEADRASQVARGLPLASCHCRSSGSPNTSR